MILYTPNFIDLALELHKHSNFFFRFMWAVRHVFKCLYKHDLCAVISHIVNKFDCYSCYSSRDLGVQTNQQNKQIDFSCNSHALQGMQETYLPLNCTFPLNYTK